MPNSNDSFVREIDADKQIKELNMRIEKLKKENEKLKDDIHCLKITSKFLFRMCSAYNLAFCGLEEHK